jgi:hypothetical protein
VEVAEGAQEIGQRPPEPIHGGDRDEIEPLLGSIAEEPIECGPIFSALSAADAVICIHIQQLPARPGRHLA